MKLTKSNEDYLEAIYLIGKEKKNVGVKDISVFLDISLPSVSEAMKKLNKKDLVKNERYGKIKLTEKGKKTARKVYDKHKTLLDFLTKILKVENKTALQEACLIEHFISSDTNKKLKNFVKKLKNNRR
ncbi:metal-dependent transcriptional regulator [Candidatus Woesearchaeota archaeon]|nr:metal-dependent transcriptional regulator [Candidatus Woesearchaeota archaeon]